MVLVYLAAGAALFMIKHFELDRSFNVNAVIVYFPLVLFLNVLIDLLKQLQNHRLARKKNAVVIPKAKNYVPFGINLYIRRLLLHGKVEPGSLARTHFNRMNTRTINIRSLLSNNYITRDPMIIKHILVANTFYNYGKGPKIQAGLRDLLGNGIFNSDPDETWKMHRAMTKPFFNRERVTDLKLNYVDRMVDVLKKLSKGPIDVQDVFSRFTFDSSVDFLFSYSTNGLEELVNGNAESGDFARAFDSATYKSLSAFVLGSAKPIYEAIFGKLLEKDLKVINPLVDKMMEEALVRQSMEEKTNTEKKANEYTCVLDYLLTQTKDRQMVKNELLNLLLAGRDTTASLLSSLFYELARNPDIYQKAREEVIRMLGQDDEPDYDTIRNSKYLRALLNETLRFYPPVPNNLRYAFNEDVVTTSEGQRYYIPAKSSVAYSLWDLHRDPKLWGPDSEVWDADRWLDSRLEKFTQNPFIFQPFSAGPRLCLGQQHAYNQATLALVRICQNFKAVELANDVQKEYLPTARLTVTWSKGVNLYFTPA